MHHIDCCTEEAEELPQEVHRSLQVDKIIDARRMDKGVSKGDISSFICDTFSTSWQCDFEHNV